MLAIKFTFQCVDCAHNCEAQYQDIGAALVCPNCDSNLQIPEEPLPIGTVLKEEYEILSLVGKGSMGVVYLAKELSSGNEHALKILRPKLARDKQHMDDFIREAEIMVKIDHPGIAAAKSFDEYEGIHYLVMDYIEGEEIAVRLWEKVVYEEKETLSIMHQAAEALMYLDEEYGIIHRDIKPENLMICPEGRVILMDLGVCQEGEEGSEDIVGTPEYMSPEQALGEGVDFRSDIYSLAMSAYHMLSGVMPMKGKNQYDTMRKVKGEEVPLIRDFRPQTSNKMTLFLHKCLMRNPQERFSSWQDFMDALATCQKSSAQEAVVTSGNEKNKNILYLASAGIVLLIALLAFQLMKGPVNADLKSPLVESNQQENAVAPVEANTENSAERDSTPKEIHVKEGAPIEGSAEGDGEKAVEGGAGLEKTQKTEENPVEEVLSAEELLALEEAKEAQRKKELEEEEAQRKKELEEKEKEEERLHQEELRRDFLSDLKMFLPVLEKKPLQAKKILLRISESGKYDAWDDFDSSLNSLEEFIELDKALLTALKAKTNKRVFFDFKGKKRRAIVNSASFSGLVLRYKQGSENRITVISSKKLPMAYLEKYVAPEEEDRLLLYYFCAKFARKQDCRTLLEELSNDSILMDLLRRWSE